MNLRERLADVWFIAGLKGVPESCIEDWHEDSPLHVKAASTVVHTIAFLICLAALLFIFGVIGGAIFTAVRYPIIAGPVLGLIAIIWSFVIYIRYDEQRIANETAKKAASDLPDWA